MVNKFFSAKSIAVIGASHDPEKIGYIIFSNLIQKFKGKVYPVNKKTQPVLGRKVYKSVKDIKSKVDLAIISVPAKYVPEVLEDCGKKGIKRVVIISGGFSEIGKKGVKLKEKIKKIKKKYKMRIIGPNVIGIYSPKNGLDAIFFSDKDIMKPREGNISILSQSGTIGALILDKISHEDLGVSKFISYGNALDVNESDIIDFFGDDFETKVIVGFIEGVRNGKKFLKVVERVGKNKPIIILKGGKTSLGARATSSHTASMAGSYKIYSSVFKQFGVVEAETWEELFDFTKIFSTQPMPKHNRLLIITNGGGFGVLATDAAEKYGLSLPLPSKKIEKKLKKILPTYAVIKNPIDLTGDADPERWKKTLKIISSSKEFDMILMIVLLQTPMMNEKIVDAAKIVKKANIPLAVALTGTGSEKIKERAEWFKIPVFDSPERAVRALAALYRRYKNLKK